MITEAPTTFNPEKNDLGDALDALLSGSPMTAVRYGLVSFVRSLVPDVFRFDFDQRLEPLRAVMQARNLQELPDRAAAMRSRASRPIEAVLRSHAVVTTLAQYLEDDFPDQARQIRTWLSTDLSAADIADIVLSSPDVVARARLAGQLLTRAAEIQAGWLTHRVNFVGGFPQVDGRALGAAMRAWRVPELLDGKVIPWVASPTSKYANRLGRVTAAIGLSKARSALEAPASVPTLAVEQSLALIAAVAEAVRVEDASPMRRADFDGHGTLSPQVGKPVGPGEFCWSLTAVWEVLDAWGSTSERVAKSVATAWRLMPVECDVALWALSVATCRLALAASMPRRLSRGPADESEWTGQVATAGPEWEQGAQRVWALMQSIRPMDKRAPWPGCLWADNTKPETWPWSDTLSDVPADE